MKEEDVQRDMCPLKTLTLAAQMQNQSKKTKYSFSSTESFKGLYHN